MSDELEAIRQRNEDRKRRTAARAAVAPLRCVQESEGMILGFTGTREGMTNAQRQAVRHWLRANPPREVHHGNCIGADQDFSAAVVDASNPDENCPHEVAHPSNIPSMQGDPGWVDEWREPLPPLERNRNIVDACNVLLACPKGPEERRSGTWSTVRAARRARKRIIIVWPDGTVEEAP